VVSWVLERYNSVIFTGSMWLRTGIDGGLLWTRKWTFGFRIILTFLSSCTIGGLWNWLVIYLVS
jgi:hypothetical protein